MSSLTTTVSAESQHAPSEALERNSVACHPDEESSSRPARIRRIIQKVGSVSQLIRMSGVAAVIVSMALFLIDGLNIVNDKQRFMTMLMLTGLLSAGGFVLAFLLKELRGARSFFGLALLSVPVNFTVLGALLYSVFRFDDLSTAYPSVAQWQIGSIASLGSTLLIAISVLSLVTVLGVSVMARESRGWLGSALLLSSSVLLLPVRDSVWIAPLAALLVIALIMLIKRNGEQTIALKTPAGRFVQALLFLPPAIMMVRSFWLYEITVVTGIVIAFTGFFAIRYFSNRLSDAPVLSGIAHSLSAIVAATAAALCIIALPTAIVASFGSLIFAGIFGGLIYELESRVESGELAEFFGIAWAITICLAVIYHQLLFSGLIVFLSGLAVIAGVIAVGMIQRKKEKFVIGCIGFLSLLVFNISNIAEFFGNAGWLGFASVGVVAIVGASMIERYGALISARLRGKLSV